MKKLITAGVSLVVLFSFGFAGAEELVPFPGTQVQAGVQGQAKKNINKEYGTNPLVNANANTTTASVSPDAACMISAITSRDNKVMTALDAYHAQVKARLQTRIDEQSGIWKLTGETRAQANKTVWTNWRNDLRTTRNTFRSAKTTAWTQFKADRTACGIKSSSETGTSSMDSSI